MVNYEFIMEKHIKEDKNKYVSPMTMLIILEEILGMKFDDIKEKVKSSEITISNEEINKFLSEGLQTYGLDNHNEETSSVRNIGELDSRKAAERFVKKLERKRYMYEPYTLEFYKRYTNIVKSKSLLLLNIIENLAKYNSKAVEELLNQLDITLDTSGRITYEDIIRILIPTVNNIKTLFIKTKEGNTVATYMINKISKEELNNRGINESEIYPLESLQVMDLNLTLHKELYVELSKRQVSILTEKHLENMEECVKSLFKNINN